MPLLQLRNACLAFGHVALLDDVGLIIEARERVCLVGRNGTGKSSLLKVLNAEQALDSGELWVDDSVTLAKLAQEVPGAADATLYDTVARGLGDLASLLSRYHKLSQDVAAGDGNALDKLADAQAEIDRIGAWDSSTRVDATLSRLQLAPEARMAECSGGIRRRAMLGQALVSEPDLLLLDEPTNHLDIQSITALEAALEAFTGAVLFVTHDRAFIDGLATRIIELDRGALTSYPGTYAAYQARKADELETEATSNRKFDRKLAEEEVWIRQGIKARRTRNEGRVRALEAMRRERAARVARTGQARLEVRSEERSGRIVFEAENAFFAYEGEAIIEDLSATILRGDRVGVIGPNGSGKSTLLKLLLGELTPARGHVRRGTRLEVAYFDQERMQLDPERSVRDNVADGADQLQLGSRTQHVVGYLRDFLFSPERVNSPVKTLSGGERNRLLLAKLFAKPANLLVLDEPTNDLDVETLELLEELLSSFQGTLLIVSHDRAFLDRTVTSTLVLEGAGRVAEYVGGYSDWRKQIDAPSASPTIAKSAPKPTKSSETRARPGRLSFAEERELAKLPALIEDLEARQAALNATASGKDFYKLEQTLVAETLSTLAAVSEELDQAYERWTALEEAKSK